MLTLQIVNYLNNAIALAAEVPSSYPATRCFVRIRAMTKPGARRHAIFVRPSLPPRCVLRRYAVLATSQAKGSGPGLTPLTFIRHA
jgi:hypothetical protein